MNIEPPKSLFDYTDEEFGVGSEVLSILMRGAGRKYKETTRALAAVVQINREREMGQLRQIELESKNFNPESDWKFSLMNHEFLSLYRLGRNQSDLILEELEKAEKSKGEEKKSHLRMADEIYQYCKKEKIKIPQPIEDYFLQRRKVSSDEERRKLYEEIREWYLENKPDYSPKRSGEFWRWIFAISILVIPLFLTVEDLFKDPIPVKLPPVIFPLYRKPVIEKELEEELQRNLFEKK